jgi:type I restriction enzyme S subunit
VTVARLGDICDVRWGDTSITKASYVASGYLAFSASGPDGYLPTYAYDGPGIVLSAIGARCGKCFLAGGRWTSIKNTIVIRPYAPEDVDIRYLHLFLNRPEIWPTAGVAQPFITMAGAQKVPVWLPRIAEQRRIAGVLASQLVGAKQLRERATHALADLNELRCQLVDDGFVDISTRAPLGRLGWLDDGDWILTADYAPSGVRLVQVGDVGAGDLNIKSSRYISVQRARELNCTVLLPGDILISRMPDPIGRACGVPDLGYPAITAVDVTIFRPSEEDLDPDYAVLYMNSRAWLQAVADRASGATRARISRKNLEQQLIPLPQLSEQRRIAARLRRHLVELDAMAHAVDATIEAIDALPNALLRRAFGNLEAA